MEKLEELSERIHELQAGHHSYLDRRIQLAIAERLEGILTEMKAKRRGAGVKVDVSKHPTA